MATNIGAADRLIRTVLSMALFGLPLAGLVTGAAGVVVLTLAALLALTAVVSYCPTYSLLGINTERRTQPR